MAGDERIDVTKLGHLATPDWRNPEDRRCIAASLVDVVYLLEKQRDTHRNEADQWCWLLQFKIIEIVTDIHDSSIFAVVFQWKGKSTPSEGGPPSLVVAFRGTLLRPKTAFKDLYLDLKIFLGCLTSSTSRISTSLQTLERIIGRQQGSKNVWIVGHSLGASIAVVAAKYMMKKGHKLEAHLFNPPFVSQWLPQLLQNIGMLISQISSTSVSLSYMEQLCRSNVPELMRLTVGLTDENKLREMIRDFLAVKDWIPTLYVNARDPICCNYIRYFKDWKSVYEHDTGIYLMQKCIKYFFCFEAIPSAKVVELVQRPSFHNHHAITQWYSKGLPIKTSQYVASAQALAEVCQLRALPASAAPYNDEDDSLERWWTPNLT